MKFETKPGRIYFTDIFPGSHVQLFAPQGPCLHVGEEANWDNAASRFTWAFAYDGPLEEGAEFIFASKDRQIVGVVRNGVIQVTGRQIQVIRDASGIPIRRA